MNIRLSCGADIKKCRGAFIVYKGGKVEVKDSFAISYKGDEATLKEYTFESLIRGLRSVRGFVNHEDLLLIELPNTHMVDWLNGKREYKGYNKYLDGISEIIDTLDCRYLFAKSNVKDVKKVLSDEKVSKMKIVGVSDAFEGM